MIIKRIYYRTFQAVFNIGARALPWRKAELVSGIGAVSRLPQLLKQEHASCPMVVAGPTVMKSGLVDELTNILKKKGITYTLFSDVNPNPSINTVETLYQTYKESACDSFIVIGGGSSMDAAKAAAARSVRPGKSVQGLGGLLKVRKRIPPFIAIPTTSGSGSETTIAAVVTDSDTHHKYAIMDISLIPRYAVMDPNFTKGLPPSVTAATGMDALTHAVEAYLCRTYNTKESKTFALDAVKLIFENLEAAYHNGTDLNTRMNMMIASYKAGFAFTRAGVGNVHAIAHTLGGLYDTPHGLANAVILPVVLEDYGEAAYEKLAILAEAAGLGKRNGTKERTAALAKTFISKIRALNKEMSLPAGFDFIKEEDIPQMVKWALAEANPVYPVPVIYDAARMKKVINALRF